MKELKAHFRQVTQLTVEVRFYFEGGYEDRSPFIGTCNLHIFNGSVEVSMLHGDFEGHKFEAIRLVSEYLKKRGIESISFEHHQHNQKWNVQEIAMHN